MTATVRQFGRISALCTLALVAGACNNDNDNVAPPVAPVASDSQPLPYAKVIATSDTGMAEILFPDGTMCVVFGRYQGEPVALACDFSARKSP